MKCREDTGKTLHIRRNNLNNSHAEFSCCNNLREQKYRHLGRADDLCVVLSEPEARAVALALAAPRRYQ